MLTNSSAVATYCRQFQDHGRGENLLPFGLNYHLPEASAAMGCVQLRKADRLKYKKDLLVQRYNFLLKDTGLILPPYEAGMFWHIYIIRSEIRERLSEALAGREIHTRRHYPPLAPTPNAEEWYRTALTLPLFADMTWGEQDLIVDTIKGALV